MAIEGESSEATGANVHRSGLAVNPRSMLDSFDPLFLQNSDIPGVNLAHCVLIGMENYTIWSKSMCIALLGKNKIGFVDGTCRKDMYEGLMAQQWERVNAVVLSWIISVVSKDLVNGIVYSPNAHKVWADLQERFDKVNATKIYHVHRGIATLTQESQRAHLSAAAQTSHLRPHYEEDGESSGSAAMNSIRHNNTKRQQKCDFCHLKGHTREQCYKLIGYHPDFKFIKNRERDTNNFRGEQQHYNSGNSGGYRDSGNSGGYRDSGNSTGYRDSGNSSGYRGTNGHRSGGYRAHNANLSHSGDFEQQQGLGFTTEQFQKLLNLIDKQDSPENVANMAGSLHWQGEGDW
ncbi:hypothetical protein KY285_020506 [Solanum tuberosum]|nr:hypothetical protein KY285_020506 [Solanum tuberosum]